MRFVSVGLVAFALTFTACGSYAQEKGTIPSLASSPVATSTAKYWRYDEIQFVDATHGFVVASSPFRFLLRTIDAGATWQVTPLPSDGEVRFFSAAVGWAVADRCVGGGSKNSPPAVCAAVIARTVDGGVTWQELVEVAKNWPWYGVSPLSYLRFVDIQTGWLLQRRDPCPAITCDDIYRTNDGGMTWRKLNLEPLSIYAIDATDKQHLWATGGRVLLFSGDGGTTWTTRMELKAVDWHSPMFQSIHFADTTHGWAFAFDIASCSASNCDGYELYRTSDGGVTWSKLTTDGWRGLCGGILTEPRFVGSQSVWIGANHGAGGAGNRWGVLVSADGGASWTCHPSPLAFRTVQPLTASRAYAIAEDSADTHLMLSTDGGTTWRDVPAP